VEPTPRLADGTVNFGRVPGEKGVWNVPYITNMGMRLVGEDGKPLAALQQPAAGRRGGTPAAGAPLGGGEGTATGGRGGAKSEPWVPFQPWAAAVYDYNSKNQSKYDPEGFCLPPGGPRMMATPYPAEIIQLPEQKRILMIFEGATHIWREIYMDGREHPKGDALNPTYLGHSVGHWTAIRLSSTSSGSTRQPGSTTSAILTPIACTSSSASAVPTRPRFTTRLSSTIRVPTRSRSASRGIFRGDPTPT